MQKNNIDDLNKRMTNESNNGNTTNKRGLLIIILLIIVIILMFFFPRIYDLINSLSLPKVEIGETNNNNENNDKVIDENILEMIHYPKMRTSIYNSNTYYSLDTFTVNDLSNGDILLNAFLDIYEGNMTSYESIGYCTNESKQFEKKYLDLRVKNIINSELNYTLENFYVPEDSNSNYVGTWNYDSINERFTYVGLCNTQATNTKYYDLEHLIKLEYEGNDINAYYYVGFAKVEGNNYTIYKDPNMTITLDTGNFVNELSLQNKFKTLSNTNKQIYKYTFKNTLCSYDEYCLYEGKWINEL